MQTGILYFYTATALNWKTLFLANDNKDIIINSLRYLSSNKSIIVYCLVIMPNHIHLLIEIPDGVQSPHKVQHSFMSYTAHEIGKLMKRKNDIHLSNYLVNAADRKY